MSEIIVDTDELKADSGTMQKGSKTTNINSSALINDINRIDPHAYGGQLAEQLAPIGSATQKKSTHVITFFDNLSTELVNRANAFEKANQVNWQPGPNDVANPINSPTVDIFGKIRQLGVDVANIIWNLGGITANPGGPGSGQFNFAVFPIIGSAIVGALTIFDNYGDIKEVAKAFFLITHFGIDDGKIIFYGAQKVKDFFDLNPHLTIELPSTYLSNLAKNANPEISGALNWSGAITVIAAVVKLAIDFVKDIQKYVSPTEIISAFVFDTVKIIGNIEIPILIETALAGAFLAGVTITGPIAILIFIFTALLSYLVQKLTDHLSDVTPAELIRELLYLDPLLWNDLNSADAKKVCGEIASSLFGPDNTDISIKDLFVKGLSNLLDAIISAVKNTVNPAPVY